MGKVLPGDDPKIGGCRLGISFLFCAGAEISAGMGGNVRCGCDQRDDGAEIFCYRYPCRDERELGGRSLSIPAGHGRRTGKANHGFARRIREYRAWVGCRIAGCDRTFEKVSFEDYRGGRQNESGGCCSTSDRRESHCPGRVDSGGERGWNEKFLGNERCVLRIYPTYSGGWCPRAVKKQCLFQIVRACDRDVCSAAI